MKKVLVFIVVCLLCGCEQDAYEKGEGKYSLMRGDFVEAQINGNKQVMSVITDDGEQLPYRTLYSQMDY